MAKDGTLWYYQSLADTFGNALGNSLSEEFDRAAKEMKSLN